MSLRLPTDRTAVLLDPHPAWLDALERVLQTIGVGVVGKATTPEVALAYIAAESPDVFVAELDVNGGADGLACVRRARDLRPALRVVILSRLDDRRSVEAALAAGAAAYVVKSAHPDDVASAIRQSFDPSVFLPTGTEGLTSLPADEEERVHGLTRRELEILALVADGLSNAELARKLWITEQTVKFHLSNIYRKLGVTNRTEASHWAHVHALFVGEHAGG